MRLSTCSLRTSLIALLTPQVIRLVAIANLSMHSEPTISQTTNVDVSSHFYEGDRPIEEAGTSHGGMQ